MLQENVIREMILWIEKNLESRLSLDTVAEKSGYTKWHFQRLFKNQTGLALGSYIRARRLSCSAVALRLTNDSIMDISLYAIVSIHSKHFVVHLKNNSISPLLNTANVPDGKLKVFACH